MKKRIKEDIPRLRQHIAILLHRCGPCLVGCLDAEAYECGYTFEALEEAVIGLGIRFGGGRWGLPDNVVPLVPRNYKPLPLVRRKWGAA